MKKLLKIQFMIISLFIIGLFILLLYLLNIYHADRNMYLLTILLFFLFIGLISFMHYLLYQKINETKEESHYKKTVLSQGSRDIRTLMNNILNYSSPIMSQDYNPKELKEALAKINSSSEILMNLIDDLMAVFNIGNRTLSLSESVETIHDCISWATDIIEPRMKEHHQKLDLKYRNIDKFRYILVNKARLQQVLTNILNYASRYSKDGGLIKMRVSGEEKSNGIGVVISIKDNGNGISEEELSSLYNKDYHKLSDTAHFELGLAMLGTIVDEMNGKIECHSKPGEGTEFILSFYWVYSDRSNVPDTSFDFSVLKGKNILLVEDDLMNAEIIEAILSKKGITMDLASDGKQAVSIFTHAMPHTYDAILMDLRMPVMDGFEATRSIREATHPEASIIPIIAMTADVFDASSTTTKEAGMNGHIVKPINPDDLYIVLTNTIHI